MLYSIISSYATSYYILRYYIILHYIMYCIILCYVILYDMILVSRTHPPHSAPGESRSTTLPL